MTCSTGCWRPRIRRPGSGCPPRTSGARSSPSWSPGHETTSGALSFALHYLARHPDLAARARAEVDQVWGDTVRPGYEQVARLRYVRRVLDEALRLWPTAPGLLPGGPRRTRCSAGTHPMRRGAWALVLDGDAAPRPGRSGARTPSGSTRTASTRRPYAPGPRTRSSRSGTGARACIGRQFALHEATLVLGLLLRRYELRPEPGLPAAGGGAADPDAGGAAAAPGAAGGRRAAVPRVPASPLAAVALSSVAVTLSSDRGG